MVCCIAHDNVISSRDASSQKKTGQEIEICRGKRRLQLIGSGQSNPADFLNLISLNSKPIRCELEEPNLLILESG